MSIILKRGINAWCIFEQYKLHRESYMFRFTEKHFLSSEQEEDGNIESSTHPHFTAVSWRWQLDIAHEPSTLTRAWKHNTAITWHIIRCQCIEMDTPKQTFYRSISAQV